MMTVNRDDDGVQYGSGLSLNYTKGGNDMEERGGIDVMRTAPFRHLLFK